MAQSPNTQRKFIEVRENHNQTALVLEGAWTIDNAGDLEREIDHASKAVKDKPVEIATDRIEKLDTSGAFLLKKLLRGGESAQLPASQRALFDFLPSAAEYGPRKKPRPSLRAAFVAIGRASFLVRDFTWDIFVFIGRIAASFFSNFLHPRRFRLPSIVRHIEETGLRALPLIGLLAVLISMVITYQAAVQLKKFGAAIYTVDLTVVSLLREMSVLITAIMVAGRSGSAFAAEIGVMQLREEVHALRTMGKDPIETLVVPRVIALVLTLPLLTLLADIIGLAAGGLMSLSLLNVSFSQYVARVQDVATLNMFVVGMIKAPVFAFVIAIIGCYQGLQVTGSAESVGKRTTLSVVQAIFIVIMADALFSVVFSRAGV
jgi:phospholipid/cholesterol/gamma-HCH transport system permease protein